MCTINPLSYFTVRDLCSSAGTNSNYNKLTNGELNARLQKEFMPETPLMRFEKWRHTWPNGKKMPEIPQMPNPISDVSDLKKRYGRIYKFSPDVANLVCQNFSLLALLSRITKVFKVNERTWLGIFCHHFVDEVNDFHKMINLLGLQKKICCVVEGVNASPKPLQGYVIGTENLKAKYLNIASHLVHMIPMLVKTRNAKDVDVQLIEDNIFIHKCFPTAFFEQELAHCFGALKQSLPLMKRFLKSENVIKVKRQLPQGTPYEIYKEPRNRAIARSFVLENSSQILELLKKMTLDLVADLIHEKRLDAKMQQTVEELVTSENNNEPYMQLHEELAQDFRNRDWPLNIVPALKYVPKNIPCVLYSGMRHIIPVLEGVQKLEKEEQKKS